MYGGKAEADFTHGVVPPQRIWLPALSVMLVLVMSVIIVPAVPPN